MSAKMLSVTAWAQMTNSEMRDVVESLGFEDGRSKWKKEIEDQISNKYGKSFGDLDIPDMTLEEYINANCYPKTLFHPYPYTVSMAIFEWNMAKHFKEKYNNPYYDGPYDDEDNKLSDELWVK